MVYNFDKLSAKDFGYAEKRFRLRSLFLHALPRRCGADRAAGRTGFCGAGGTPAACAALHYWEDPCISGTRGSGAVFFSGCTLKCCFCQNYPISAEGLGREITR